VLHFVLDPSLEADDLGEVDFAFFSRFFVPLVHLLLLVVIKEVGSDVEFNRVITRCDSVHVPFNVVTGLHFFDEVKVVSHKKSNKYGSTSKYKACLLPRDKRGLWKLAADLNKDL